MTNTGTVENISTNVSVFDKFKQNVKKAAGPLLGLYNNSLLTARSTAEALKPLSYHATVFSRALIPFRALGLVGAAYEVSNLVSNLKQIPDAPKNCKRYPTLKVLIHGGAVIDNGVAAVGIIEEVGLIGARNAVLIGAPLGLFALGLQSLGLGLSAWSLHKIDKAEKNILKRLGKNPGLENYRAGLEYLVKSPEAEKKKKIFKREFLGLLNEKQKSIISEILEKKGEDEKALKATSQLVKRHIQHCKTREVLSIALTIISMIGVMTLIFSTAALAPVGWTILAVVGVGSLALMGYAYGQNRLLNRALVKILPQVELSS